MARASAIGPEPLSKPAVIFVEGTNDLHFFDRALRHVGKREAVALRSYDGKANLGVRLADLVVESGFSTTVRKLVIMRDADDSAEAAFQSVASAVQARQWHTPARHGEWAQAHDGLEVAGYILPDGQGQGELETLLNQALGNDGVNGCIDSFLDCLRANGAPIPTDHQQSKHRFFALVATLPEPDNKFGVLANKTPDFWTKPAFANLLAFLRTI